jgi:glycosyltransferase involved in cell wall biosynthesis
MAMAKAVVVTASSGQTDMVLDRRGIDRDAGARPVCLLRQLAERAGIHLEANGLYVPPGDPEAMRRAIVYLLDHPEERTQLGQAGRRAVESLLTVDHFAERMAELVYQALDGRTSWPGRVAAPSAS